MPKPRKGGGGGWGIQSVVNGWINVNEHQLAPADIHELQQLQQQSTSATGGGGDGGGVNPPLHSPGAAAIAAAAAAGDSTDATGRSVNNAGRRQKQRHPQQQQQQRNRYSEPGSYSHSHSSHSGLYPPGGPVPGDGRVILGRRESTELDRAGSSSKWGPEPLPLSPEASPMMMPASGGSGGSQPGPLGGQQPPHLGLDASSSAQSRSSHSHSHSNLSSSRGGGSSSMGNSYGNSHSHGYSLSSSYRGGGSMLSGPGGPTGPTGGGGMAASSASLLSGAGGFHVGNRKSSMQTHTSATEGEMTLSDGHQSSNFSDRSAASMSLLSSPYRRNSGQQYDGPAAPASVGNVLGGGSGVSGGGIGAALGASASTTATATASAIPTTTAAAAKGEELISTAPFTAAMSHHDNNMVLNSTKFASAGTTTTGYGKRRSSYQSSELEYSTSAAGGSTQFGTSPYLNSRRASALTELTVSTIPSRRDSGSPPEEEEQHHQYRRSSSGGGGDGAVSMRSTKSSSASTVGSGTSRATTKSRKKERNALRRTNSQSDILKVMAGGGVGQTHLSLEEKSRRKSDAFLRKVHEMQVQQRQKLIAVQEAEELRTHHLEGDEHQRQPQLHQYPTAATGRSDRSLSVSGSGTSGSVTVAHDNTALSVNTKGTGSSDNAQVQIPAGTMEAPPQIHRGTSASTKGDDASEDNSIQKFVSGILGMGAPDEKGKQSQQQKQRSTSSDKQQPSPQQKQQLQQQMKQQKQLLHQVQLHHQQQQQRGPTNTGQYLNEAAFVQHVERQRAAAMAIQQQQQKQSSSSVAGSSSGRSKRSSKGDSRRRSDDGLPLNTVSAIPSSAPENQRALYPGQQPPLHPPPQQQGFGGQSTHQHPLGSGTTGRGGYVVTGPGVVQPIAPRSQSQHHGHGTDSKSCAQCTILEKQLIALQADLDYLRSIITQNEFICAECEEAPSSSKGSSKRRSSSAAVPSSGASVSSTKSKKSISTSASRKGKKSKFGSSAQLSQLSGDADKPHESDALNDASQGLMAVASRHKRQIEQMTKETARWQNDMHLKLSKMSMMCKDLNDESSKRKEEATNIQATLAKVRADRNALESEVESLRARIALYEKEDVENDRVSQALGDKETTELDRMDTAIEDRDGALTNMSSQLDRALTSLEAEKKERMESQRASAHSTHKKSMSFNPTSSNETSFFNPLLGIARAARVDEGRAENDEVAETTRKEDELQKRCNALEKELEAAQEKLRKSAANA